jgi:hypothetical protein
MNNKVNVDPSLRHVVIQIVESNNTKITINPVEGEIRIKIPNKEYKSMYGDWPVGPYPLDKLVEQVKRFKDFDTLTYRGKVKPHNGELKVCMAPERKGLKNFQFSEKIV